MPKILAIDDKEDNLITLSAILKNLIPDCNVITAQSGFEGIEKAKDELPDTILLDIKMPKMDGYEVCVRLKDDEDIKHIPVIMLSAIKTESDDRIKGFDCGADAYLAKPIDEYVLIAQVKTALRIKASEDRLRNQKDLLEELVLKRTSDLLKTNQQLKREIEERKQAEEEKYRLHEQLQQAQKMEAIGTLAGGIAHDFNNILSAIIGFSELAINEAPKETKLYENMEQVLKAGHRAKDLVKQILAFSRKGAQEEKPVSVVPIVEEVLKLLQASLPATIEIRQSYGTDLGAVMADPTQLHQVLMNLCTNAAHAMREKGGVLDVKLSRIDLDSEFAAIHTVVKPGPHVKLTVSDTGHGMSPEVLKKIFEPYFTTKERGEGTGMGLAVVLGIVESYGGTITAKSELGKGAAFDVLIPILDATAEKKYEEPKMLPSGTERILFVDDEQFLIDIADQMLTRLGYNVTTRISSVEALKLFESDPDRFDLVITDMDMPNMSGDSLAQTLIKIRSDIPIILCTGYSDRIDKKRAKGLGIKAFAMKPIVMRDVAVIVRKVLDS